MEGKPSRRWTNTQSVIVLAVMIIGAILAATWPIWIAPPNVASTFWVYGLLLIVWLPLLIILAILRYRGAVTPFIFLFITGVIITLVAIAWGGPYFNAWAYEAKNCTAREVVAGQTEYTCKLFGFLGGSGTLILQGPTGFPLARLISHTYQSAP
jgi:hypothetical protein